MPHQARASSTPSQQRHRRPGALWGEVSVAAAPSAPGHGWGMGRYSGTGTPRRCRPYTTSVSRKIPGFSITRLSATLWVYTGFMGKRGPRKGATYMSGIASWIEREHRSAYVESPAKLEREYQEALECTRLPLAEQRERIKNLRGRPPEPLSAGTLTHPRASFGLAPLPSVHSVPKRCSDTGLPFVPAARIPTPPVQQPDSNFVVQRAQSVFEGVSSNNSAPVLPVFAKARRFIRSRSLAVSPDAPPKRSINTSMATFSLTKDTLTSGTIFPSPSSVRSTDCQSESLESKITVPIRPVSLSWYQQVSTHCR